MGVVEKILSDKTSLCKLRSNKCPNCGEEYTDYPALSRVDNKTEICPACGQDEAFAVWAKARRY